MKTTMNDPRLSLVEAFFSGTGTTYDAVVQIATFGIDARWKRTIIKEIPAGATRILDLACGTGILTLAIARRFTQAEVVGVELRDEYLDLARAKQRAAGIRNVTWCLGRAEEFSPDAPFDCVVSSYLAKYADVPRLATAAASWLKPDGLFVAHDFTLPPHRVLIQIWKMYFWLLQHIGGPLLPAWRQIFHGLPGLIQQTRWQDELREALQCQGFQDIQVQHLTLYGSSIITARNGHPPSGRPSTPTRSE
ncbi:MAG: class I SAM-dependent methyltransferase [Nitrospiraceae bacterium]|nr:class I SAM-dependent methyltransferase [Nitrospiraceae bacterium]